MKRKWPKTPHDVYCFLNHAMLHCKYGSNPQDRTPDAGDLAAYDILQRLRWEVATETYAANVYR